MELEFLGRTRDQRGSDTKVFRPFSEFILSHFDKLRACPEFIEGTGWAEGLKVTARLLYWGLLVN